VIGADTSIIFKTDALEPLLSITEVTGLFGTFNNFGQRFNHWCQTSPEMFDYFGVKNRDAVGSLNQMEAGIVVYYRNFLNALIMKAWVTCALDENCMAKGCSHCRCCSETGCHRFDQSALTMIVSFFLQYPKSNRLRTAHAIPYRDYYSVSRPQNIDFLDL
jgi:hypothetical protein